MASIRVSTPAYNTQYNEQQKIKTAPVAAKNNTFPGQPTYQATAGSIQRQATQPIQKTSISATPAYQNTAGAIQRPTAQPMQQANIAVAPEYQNTAGTLGSYTAGKNWDQNLAKIGQTVNKSSVGAYQNPGAAPAGSSLDRQNQAYVNAQGQATIQNPENAGYQQSNLQEGFDADYLKKLSASQIDPLKEAYEESLRLAGADFNRLGLRGSGFEVGDKFGSQPGSITSRYLTEIGNVARDVALRGAEAEREDRYRQQEFNEANRQNWSTFDQNLDQQNFANRQAMLDASGRMVEQDESSKQFWARDELDRDLASRDYQLKAIDTSLQADQQDQANQQWWSNFQQQQLTADDQAAMDRWKSAADLGKWGAERSDQAREFDAGQDLQWADFKQQQLTADDQAMMDRWKSMADIQKFDATRTDQAREFDAGQDLRWADFEQGQLAADDKAMMDRWKSMADIQQWDAEQSEKSRQFDVGSQLEADKTTATIKNQNIANMIEFMRADGATAQQMQAAYWQAIKEGNNTYNANTANNAQTSAWLQGLFK